MSTLPQELTMISAWSDHVELLRCPRCAAGLATASSGLNCAAAT